MENRFLVGALLWLACWLAITSAAAVQSAATTKTVAEQAAGDQVPAYSQRRQIRFYKANRQGQTTRISFTARRARREGCQNFLKRTRVFQANQYGFAQCRLYSKRNCQAASILSVTRDKLPEPVTELSQGYSWHPVAEHKRGAKVRSWDCWVSDPAVTEPKAE